MSETNKKTTPTKDPKQRINELLETGKQKGVLSYKEIMDALQELELDQEAVEKLYEAIEEQNIDVVEEVEVPEIIPILTLRSSVLFPGAITPITVGRDKSINLVRAVNAEGGILGAVTYFAGRLF